MSVKTDAFWMPFTANRQFKAEPRLLVGAEGMHYRSEDGRTLLDGTAGLWCVNAGHGREAISTAVHQQISTLDYGPTFQMGHPAPFELAERLIQYTPEGLNKVFFTNSGSESVDTALKIALAYHRARGEGQRTRLIGREKGYHGVGFGGISVGGLVNNKRAFGPGLPNVSHLRHTLLDENAFSRGLPEQGADLADDLERMIALYGADTIAAVIVEPVAGSAGVVLPPVGYLKRLRDITRRHGILLIFDEVITGFGRVGEAFASMRFDVTPDLMTTAKGLTNGAVPMGAVFAADFIHDAFMERRRTRPSSCSTATPTPAIRSPPRPAWRRSTSTRPKGCSSAPWNWKCASRTPCTASATWTRSRTSATSAWSAASNCTRARAQVGARGYEVFHHCYWTGQCADALHRRYAGAVTAADHQ